MNEGVWPGRSPWVSCGLYFSPSPQILLGLVSVCMTFLSLFVAGPTSAAVSSHCFIFPTLWHFLFPLFQSPYWTLGPYLGLPHFFIFLSSFVVLHPTPGFQMHSLPLLISCYFPQSSCKALLSHSSFPALHLSYWFIGMPKFGILNLPVT